MTDTEWLALLEAFIKDALRKHQDIMLSIFLFILITYPWDDSMDNPDIVVAAHRAHTIFNDLGPVRPTDVMLLAEAVVRILCLPKLK